MIKLASLSKLGSSPLLVEYLFFPRATPLLNQSLALAFAIGRKLPDFRCGATLGFGSTNREWRCARNEFWKLSKAPLHCGRAAKKQAFCVVALHRTSIHPSITHVPAIYKQLHLHTHSCVYNASKFANDLI